MKLKNILLAAAVALGMSSCNDWLDVSPKSQIEQDDHFSREGGYNDQLIGVYTRMASSSMYKDNMGVGLVEVLSQNYDINYNSETWRYVADYDYSNPAVESRIANMWQSTYSCIANLNVMIENIEKADPKMFTDNHYDLYKGEAYGLRGFLHFELMRLFAQAPSMSSTAPGVPYSTSYSIEVPQQKNVAETMQMIIDDLEKAQQLLECDSLYSGVSPYSWRPTRTMRFNYYAATLALARAYLWAGNKEKARENALIVTGVEGNYSTPWSWVHYTTMEQAQKTAIDYTFSCEHLFYLTMNDWDDLCDQYFHSTGGVNTLSPSDTKCKEIFEVENALGNDYRYQKHFEQDGEDRYLSKFWYREGGAYNGIYPILRASEACYILAECLKDSKPAEAVGYLNKVREARNLRQSVGLHLPENLTAAEIQNEIFKEYRKEFLGEGGQLFFYYKRLNASEIKGTATRGSKAVYVLPIPKNDVEFGGYGN